jgi:hypothetical protein
MSLPPSGAPRPGAFAHQHGDPRNLRERIDAQLRERLEEAAEMAALELLIALRRKTARPAPREDSAADREEFRALTDAVLEALDRAFAAELPQAERDAMAAARVGPDARSRALAGQVFLARRLPDYWQRFERHRLAHAGKTLAAPVAPSGGWLRRILGG